MTTLIDDVLDRASEAALSPGAQGLILAALLGDDNLAEALGGTSPTRPTPADSDAQVPGTYLSLIQASGFRGIGGTAEIDVKPGPGLTLVVGRNGSGKSSFAEAAELALTGQVSRWKSTGTVWTSAWRNLHKPTKTGITVKLAQEGVNGKTDVQCVWADDAELNDVVRTFKAPGSPESPADQMGWGPALENHRPFLSYSELGEAVTGTPSKLYDALFTIPGLGDVDAAASRLGQQARTDQQAKKAATAARKELQAAMAAAPDERAQAAAALLKKQSPDLGALEALASGDTKDPDSTLATLEALASINFPTPEQLATVTDELRAAAERVTATREQVDLAALELADLLTRAAEHVLTHGDGPCPVCGGTQLDTAWAQQATARAEKARADNDALATAQKALQTAQSQAHILLTTAVRPEAIPAEHDQIRAALTEWHRIDPTAGTAAEAITELGTPLHNQISELREDARNTAQELRDQWRPLALRLAAWVKTATELADRATTIGDTSTAAKWLKETTQKLREDRIRPYATAATQVWNTLKQESSVQIGNITLAGTNTTRKVAIDVEVDGQPGAALGVMSQGELHALGLALFIPRATNPDSPFRFLILDDPVQAMDPAKVDGLALTLSQTAETRQVIVFTHDNRLPDAVRRMGLEATIWQVVRKENSEVEVQKAEDPVDLYLTDARALASTEDLPAKIKGPIIAGFCRSAIEAAAQARIRTVRLSNGESHTDVEDLLTNCGTTKDYLSTLMFGDTEHQEQVVARVEVASGGPRAWALRTVIKAVHGNVAFDDWDKQKFHNLITNTKELAKDLGKDKQWTP